MTTFVYIRLDQTLITWHFSSLDDESLNKTEEKSHIDANAWIHTGSWSNEVIY